MKKERHLPRYDDVAPPQSSSTGASTHDAIPLPGCVVHAPQHVEVVAWISGILRCVDDPDPPPTGLFTDFEATFQVQTFDEIDLCIKIAVIVLSLEPETTLGLRELIVNAVEHGNLEIDFDHKSALLAAGEWQDEIEARLATTEFRDRYAAVHLSRDGDAFMIRITDEGPGFDWRTHLDPDTAPKHMLHGRGMSLAMGAGFKSVAYLGDGNEVVIHGVCATGQDS